ncbi:MAG: site-specific integrase, partial [Chloroflexi bacterium]|nr:site-specific integrase [Chloroflexota bacterium]
GMAIYLAAYSGMRRGEIAGLKWQDVDFDGNAISVARELIFVPKLGYRVTPLKSAKSRRSVDVTSNVIAELRRHRAAQAEQQLRLGTAWHDEGWVIAKEDAAETSA